MLCNNLKALRKERRLTLEELAKRLGTSKQTIQRYENGVIANVPPEKIEKLAEALAEAVSMLKRIRKPDEIPDRQGFRKLLSEGRCAHNAMLSGLHTGTIPRSSAQTIFQLGRLRGELSRAFDELVEIMLNNI